MLMLMGLLTFFSLFTISSVAAAPPSLTSCYREEKADVSGKLPTYRYKCDQLGFTAVPDVNTPYKNRTIKVSMKRNKILAVENEAFIGMIILEEIDLDDNRISNIQPDAFFSVQRLKILSLGNNLLETVPTQALGRTPDLSDLDLSRNRIGIIRNTDFRYLTQLKRLELSGNNISRVEPLAFKDLHELMFLSLASNQIRELEPAMDRPVPFQALQSFQVQDNPWHCDCMLRWVFTRTATMGIAAAISCATPDRMRDRVWSELHPVDFACEPDIWRTSGDDNGTLEAVEGFSATLTCGVYSDPIGLTRWYRDGELVSDRDTNSRLVLSATKPSHGSLKNYTYVSELKIASSVVNDTATYVCEILNNAGAKTANISLVIVEPASKNQAATTLLKTPRAREATALHYALIACSAIACIVTLISVVACAFYCTKRLLLMRYAARCRAYRPAKQESDVHANLNNMNMNVVTRNMNVESNANTANFIMNSASDDLSTYRSCNFVDNYHCLNAPINMLSEPDGHHQHQCEYANISENDGSTYFTEIHPHNLPLKNAMVVLQSDGLACHHVLNSSQNGLNKQLHYLQNYESPHSVSVSTQPNGTETFYTGKNDSQAQSNTSTPMANAPQAQVQTSAGGPGCITFKPAVTPAHSTTSFSTLTLLKSSRKHNGGAGNPMLYAPIASNEDDQGANYNNSNHKRTASVSAFTGSATRQLGSDQMSLI